ncbi:hypothetical protein [Brachybacterium sp. FME24]|uniref:hypothetical protein n=1 Tax=Brachybacterium sp. FME24 TaxID=2742605 RepID=UPI0018667EA8|nr:hypothetical protein [Brachybacterium sp. FME24]
MINQLRADLYVLRHSPTASLCLLVASVAAALYTWLQHSLIVDELSAASANGVQGLSDILLVSLLGPLLYGVVLSQPFETRSVHNALLASGRGAFVASKATIAAVLVTALSLPYGVAVLIGRATGAEFAPAIPTAFSLALAEGGDLTGQAAGSIVALTLTSAVLTAAKLAVCLPLAIWLKRPLVVMAAGFVWSFLADLLAGAAADVDGLDALVRLTPFSAEHLPAPGSTGGEMLSTVAVSIVFIALMGALSWLIFRRADVK